MSDIPKEIQELMEYDNQYAIGESPISDIDYDLLKSKAQKKYPKHEYFEGISISDKAKGEEVPLPYNIGSLRKVKPETYDKWKAKIDDDVFVIYDKLDGISFYNEYDDGKLYFGATRGDGKIGVDITEKLKMIIPVIASRDNCELRGEIILTGDDHKKLGYKTRRNGVAGLFNRDDMNNIHLAKAIIYEVISVNGEEFKTETERIEYLKSLGLFVCRHRIMTNPSVDDLVEIFKGCKENQEYDSDGLVIVPNNYVREDVAKPKNKVAFKVNENAVECNVVNVEWNVGRTGRIIPVVEIEPVEIGGVTVSRATAHNAKFVKDNKIVKGCKVYIYRSNDVIPYIVEVKSLAKEDNLSFVCPNCSGYTMWKGVDLVCTNSNCMPYKKLAYFLRTNGAENITEKTLEKIEAKSLEELFEMDEFDLSCNDGIGMKKAQQIIEETNKILTTTKARFVAGLGIPLIGVEISKLITDKFKLDDLFSIDTNSKAIAYGKWLTTIDGIGEAVAKSFVSNIGDYKEFYEFMKSKGLKIKEDNGKTKGKIFALTGSSPTGIKRDTYIKAIEDEGGFVKGVSKKTNFLVTANLNSNSSKMKKAKEYDIEIISYEELEELLEM